MQNPSLRGGYANGINALEKEELQQQKRTLKLQMNVIRDENMRLKTRMAFMQQEMDHKDRDIEQLTIRIHQSALAATNKDNSTSNIGNANNGGGS